MTSKRKGMPRGWLKPSWIVEFGKKSPLSIVDKPDLYIWIRDNHYPDVTVLQYRVAVRRMVSPMGAGYRAIKLPAEICNPLRVAVEELGKKMWGFQKAIQTRDPGVKSKKIKEEPKEEKKIILDRLATTRTQAPLDHTRSEAQLANHNYSVHSADLLLPQTPPAHLQPLPSTWIPMDPTTRDFDFQTNRNFQPSTSSASESGSESDSNLSQFRRPVAFSRNRAAGSRSSSIASSRASSQSGASLSGSKRRLSNSWYEESIDSAEAKYEPKGVHLENLKNISLAFYSLNVSSHPEDDENYDFPKCPRCSGNAMYNEENPASQGKCPHRGWHQSLPTVTEEGRHQGAEKEHLLELTREFYSLGSSQCHYQLTEREMLAHFNSPEQVGFFVSPKGRLRNKLCTLYCNRVAVDLLQADPCKQFFPIFHKNYLPGFLEKLTQASEMDFPICAFQEVLMYTNVGRVIIVDVFMKLHQRGELYCWFRQSKPSSRTIKPASHVIANAKVVDLLNLSERL